MKKIKLAVLDLYNGLDNQGMRCIYDILNDYKDQIVYDTFDVRQKNEIPDLSYDIYISSGGPGNPLEGDGKWDKNYYNLIDSLWNLNKSGGKKKKHMFFICHSFQMACNHFGLGQITKRKSTSFGVLPVHKTASGLNERILSGLDDPFFVVDSRDYQLVQPDLKVFKNHGASILALEKIRTHVEYERAIMAIKFSDTFIGTQFHPEADARGMTEHFLKKDNRDKVIANFGEDKYYNMMYHLNDPDKIHLTHNTIIPNFIENALGNLVSSSKMELVV